MPEWTATREVAGWGVALHFVKGLRGGASRFVEARRLTDVEPTEKFQGERIEQLLAFMARHGFRFAEADTNGEDTYQLLFTEMVNYHTELHRLQVSLQLTNEKELQEDEKLAQRADELFQKGFRSSVDDFKSAMAARQPQHPVESFRDLSEGIANLAIAGEILGFFGKK